MLVLSRKRGDQIRIDEKITITVLRISSGKVRIGVEAPQNNRIMRMELAQTEAVRPPCEAGT
jgi:carbon storage regulator